MSEWATVQAIDIAAASRWDAEFFVNPYNDYLNKLFARWTDWISLKAASDKLTSGHTPLRHDVTEGDTPFVTVECVDPLRLNADKTKRIWAAHAIGELSRACVSKGDLLITIKRRIGISSPVLDDPGLMAVNQDVVVMTPKKGFRPGYVAAVLNSRIGQFQALRHATEQMNPYLNVTSLGQLLIPRVSDPVQRKIEAVVQACLAAHEQSVSGYREAEDELLERIGWEKLRQQPTELFYVRELSELRAATRADAEYFQPQYVRLRTQLIRGGAKPIGEFCPKPVRGVQPQIVEGGDVVVVDSKSVRQQGIDPSVGEHTSREFHDHPQNAKARVVRSDVLLNSTGRGTLGRAACYQLDSPAICDNHVAILRPDQHVCDPTYLSLFLNSPAGLAQSEQFQTGSSGQLEIYPEHVQQFLVFLPQKNKREVDLAWQTSLARKVQGAIAAKAIARDKLEEAKQLAEKAIA